MSLCLFLMHALLCECISVSHWDQWDTDTWIKYCLHALLKDERLNSGPVLTYSILIKFIVLLLFEHWLVKSE